MRQTKNSRQRTTKTSGEPRPISDAEHKRLHTEILRKYGSVFRMLAAYDRGEITLDDLR